MKIKLTPEFCYLAGITKYMGVSKGIGVSGDEHLQLAFAAAAISAGVADPKKINIKQKSVRVYHSAYESYIHRVQRDAVDKFKHLNEYAASYLAGIFDSVGVLAENSIYLKKCDKVDDAILENLGFRIKKVEDRFWIGHYEQFLRFIKEYRKVDDVYLQHNSSE